APHEERRRNGRWSMGLSFQGLEANTIRRRADAPEEGQGDRIQPPVDHVPLQPDEVLPPIEIGVDQQAMSICRAAGNLVEILEVAWGQGYTSPAEPQQTCDDDNSGRDIPEPSRTANHRGERYGNDG